MFEGSIVALITPMQDSGEIDYEAYGRLLAWHIREGTDGVVILGTTGEAATVSAAERTRLIQIAVETVNHRMPIIVGTGTCSTAQTIANTREAEMLGADAALLIVPYYNKPTQEGLVQHFTAIAKAVEFPQILYNVPTRTVCDLLPETVIRLAGISPIIGIKEATGDVTRIEKIINTCVGFAVWSGDDATACDALHAGAQGVISVVANIVPRDFHTLCRAMLSGDAVQARAINARLQPLYEALFCETNPIPVKQALAWMHDIPNGIRLPLTALSEDYKKPLCSVLEKILIGGTYYVQ